MSPEVFLIDVAVVVDKVLVAGVVRRVDVDTLDATSKKSSADTAARQSCPLR